MTVLTYPHVPAVGTIPVGLDVPTGSQFDLSYRDHTLIVGDTLAGKTSVLGLYAAGVAPKPDVALAIIDGDQCNVELRYFEPRATWFAPTPQCAAETVRDLHAIKEMRMRVLLKEHQKRWSGNEILVLVDGYASLDEGTRLMVSKLLRYRCFGIHLVIATEPSHFRLNDRDIANHVLALDGRQPVSRDVLGYALGRRERVAVESREFRAHTFNTYDRASSAFDPYRLDAAQAASIGAGFASYRIPLARVWPWPQRPWWGLSEFDSPRCSHIALRSV